MARLIRPLRQQQWPVQLHHQFSRSSPSLRHLFSTSLSSTVSCCRAAPPRAFSFGTSISSSHRSVHTRTRARGPRFVNAPRSAELEEKEGETGGSDSDSDGKKGRNELKREARRAVRWGMEIAAFAPPQIKRILRMASLEREVFEALTLVKRLGPDVKEGKRRQYNYIGKLLRDVEPELMDALIHATKDGDWSRLQGIPGFKAPVDEADDKVIEDEFEEEEEVSEEQVEMATRWFDGLITNDVDITKEVYAVRVVDFDRQELRILVRKVQAVQERESDGDEESEKKVAAAMATAKKSLNRFLLILAKQMPTDESDAIEFS